MIGIKKIWQVDEKSLGIIWNDDKEDTFDVVTLRKNCPCAACVNEHTGEKIEQNISDDVRPKSIDSVGRYAIKFTFSDGHSTGIYSFDYLRNLKPLQL